MTCPRSSTADECTSDAPCQGCKHEAASFMDPDLPLIPFCEPHWSWLCGTGKGKCQSDPPGAVTLPAPTPGGDQR